MYKKIIRNFTCLKIVIYLFQLIQIKNFKNYLTYQCKSSHENCSRFVFEIKTEHFSIIKRLSLEIKIERFKDVSECVCIHAHLSKITKAN